MKARAYTSLFSLLIVLVFSTCSKKSEEYQKLRQNVINQYAQLVHTSYESAHHDAQKLQNAIKLFLDKPSEERLQQAKTSWIKARASYGKTEAFRFYGGPIDNETGPEGQLNAWPLDESYIDYVAGGVENKSIISQIEEYPEITANLIASLNEKGSETNVASGYHAIEFLLWGQDLSKGPGPGKRPVSDYIVNDSADEALILRRRKYLEEVTTLLLNDLKYLINEWSEGEDNYRSSFVASPQKSIGKIISGLGKLSKGELAGERMFVAYDLRSKEDEHSCFSDNTHNDIIDNAVGIRNVFLGTYSTNGNTIAGPGLYDLIHFKHPKLAENLKQKIKESVASAKAIKPPFDQEFLNETGRKRIAKTITSLREQGDLFAEAAKRLGYTFDPSAV